MSEEQLGERIRRLEIRAAVMLASLATLATCCAAFLGYQYYQIPNRIEEKVNELVDKQVNKRVPEEVENKIGQTMMNTINNILEKGKSIDDAFEKAQSLQSKIERIKGQGARTMVVGNGEVVHPPEGTKKEDWVAFIAPMDMGRYNIQEQRDDAFLAFSSGVTEKDDGWEVKALFLYRYNSSDEGNWHQGKANVLLIPSLTLPSCDQETPGTDSNMGNWQTRR